MGRGHILSATQQAAQLCHKFLNTVQKTLLGQEKNWALVMIFKCYSWRIYDSKLLTKQMEIMPRIQRNTETIK